MPKPPPEKKGIHPAWYAMAFVLVLAFAVMEWPDDPIPPSASGTPSPKAPPAAPMQSIGSWQPVAGPLPGGGKSDYDVIVDPSVAETEEEEKTADPYAISEPLVLAGQAGRVEPGYDDIATAAEEAPDNAPGENAPAEEPPVP